MSAIGPISPANNPNPFVGPINPVTVSGGPLAFFANYASLLAFTVSAPVVVTWAHIYVGIQSGNIDLGIYRGPLGGTKTRLGSTGSKACPAPGAADVVFTAPIALVPGVLYWSAYAVDNGTATVTTVGSSASYGQSATPCAEQVATSFPLPASIAFGGASGSGTLVVFG